MELNNSNGNATVIAVAGGGTGGHVYPALAVAEELRKNKLYHLIYLGRPGGLEEKLSNEADIPFYGVSCGPFDRGRPLSLISSVPRQLAGGMQAARILRSNRASVVLMTGGYAGLPAGLGAVMLRIPLILHEQNAVSGVANRMLSPFASVVAHGTGKDDLSAASAYRFGTDSRFDKNVFVGNPVRPGILNKNRDEARKIMGVNDGHFFILAFGGSGGSASINQAVSKAAGYLPDDTRILLGCGKGRLKDTETEDDFRLRVVEYIDDMAHAYAAADLVISRAGAITLAEITAVGKPAIVVPYPFATGDHQRANAELLRKAGALEIIIDQELEAQGLASRIMELRNTGKLSAMSKASRDCGRVDAAAALACIVERYAASDRSAG